MMADDAFRLQSDQAAHAAVLRKDIESSQLLRPTDAAEHDGQPMAGKIISLIEERSFMRECIRIGLELASSARIKAFSSVRDYQEDKERGQSSIILLACSEMDEDFCEKAFSDLLEIEPGVPVIVLGPPRPELLSAAVMHGAKGYIPLTTKFEVAVAVMRVVLAGGTYVPMDCLPNQGSRERGNYSRERGKSSGALTAREISVVRAIQLGKSNKAIAYGLNMTESTVKVHVRHIMAKLKAKNRTEIAIMSKKYMLGPEDELSLDLISGLTELPLTGEN
jgi:DNA-binding NarL/FixJ family response regulator